MQSPHDSHALGYAENPFLLSYIKIFDILRDQGANFIGWFPDVLFDQPHRLLSYRLSIFYHRFSIKSRLFYRLLIIFLDFLAYMWFNRLRKCRG
nr:MAG TPA: hypothetical protein [Caudoviricetes sp.]